MLLNHFGIRIKDKPSNHINKELYLTAKPEGLPNWTEAHYAQQLIKAEFNYDLNMAYFDSLDYDKFDEYTKKQIKKYKFVECLDLNELKGAEGVYMLVLDNYKQVYIGQSQDIKRRILNHWNGRKSLERLIFGDICSSILSIDSFGVLDTTRIFYIKTWSKYEKEEKIVASFNAKYLLNRTAGGIGGADSYIYDVRSAMVAVVANQKKRNFLDYVDVNKLKEIVGEKSFNNYYLTKYPELESDK